MTFIDRFVSESRLQPADAGIDADTQDGVVRRADLIFYGVDHSRDSYEGRVFFNNPDADRHTQTTPDTGYVGSFFVFGHERCVGGPGHCNPDWGHAEDALDYRRPHHLEPQDKTVTVTAALAAVPLDQPIQLTVVAIPADTGDREHRPLLQFESVRLLTYR